MLAHDYTFLLQVSSQDDTGTQPYVTLCSCKYITVWLVCMYAYKGNINHRAFSTTRSTLRPKIGGLGEWNLVEMEIRLFLHCDENEMLNLSYDLALSLFSQNRRTNFF